MYCGCCTGPRVGPGWGAWGHRGLGYWYDYPFSGPPRSERKERLEELKKDLEARLADVSEELGKL